MSYFRIVRENVRAGYVTSVAPHVPGLVGFDHQFDDSDHHLAQFAAGGMTSGRDGYDFNSYLMLFADLDYGPLGTEGGDQRSYTADYYDMSGFAAQYGADRVLTVNGSRRGSGEMTLSIPPVLDDEVVFLRGFMIQNGFKESNHHIRAVGVRFDPRINAWRVTYRDDSPSDDSFSADVFYYKVKKVESEESANAISFGDIQTVTAQFNGSTTVRKNGVQGVTLLAGFHFEFTDSDHHVRKIAVDLRDIRQVGMTFKDNGSPSVAGLVDYVEFSGYH